MGGGFEAGLSGWNDFWSRDPAGGGAVLDGKNAHGGRNAVRIEHTGSHDWSFNQRARLDVTPGQIYELSGWVRLAGEAAATLCVALYDREGGAIHWSFGGRTAHATDGWRDRKSTRLNSSHIPLSRMPSSA